MQINLTAVSLSHWLLAGALLLTVALLALAFSRGRYWRAQALQSRADRDEQVMHLESLEEALNELKEHQQQLLLSLTRCESERDHLQATHQELKQRLHSAEQAGETAIEKSHALQRELELSRSQARQQREAAEEKLALLERAREELRTQFEQLAQKIFEDRAKVFDHRSGERLESMLKPFRTQLDEFRKQVSDSVRHQDLERRGLHEQLGHLKSMHERMSDEAQHLTRALTGNAKSRGDWGELALERLLEASGLQEGREYERQAGYSRDGRALRPDVVVHLPQERDVVIDAKVNLPAYSRYCESDDKDERDKAMRDHLAALRRHVDDLARKDYGEAGGDNTFDMVLMFVPIEAAFIDAIKVDASLYDYAYERGVMMVSPANLLVALKTVATMWQVRDQNANALHIANEAGKMYDKLVNFVDSLEEVGQRIRQADEAYQTAHKRLSSGRGNLIAKADQLKQLGAKASKQLRQDLREAAASEDPEADISIEEDEPST